jgi:hypothetical protein
MTITLTISKLPDGGELFTGFKYVWLRYVRGFDSDVHCQRSLKGYNDPRFVNKMTIGKSFELDDPAKCRHIYLCADAVIRDAGLHFALLPEEGAAARVTTYNGIEITATNARQLAIPALPDGFGGKEHAFTSCCNWQFGVEYYGMKG